jgi:hypothetical protein
VPNVCFNADRSSQGGGVGGVGGGLGINIYDDEYGYPSTPHAADMLSSSKLNSPLQFQISRTEDYSRLDNENEDTFESSSNISGSQSNNNNNNRTKITMTRPTDNDEDEDEDDSASSQLITNL